MELLALHVQQRGRRAFDHRELAAAALNVQSYNHPRFLELYGSALAYMSAEELRASRMMIVDDAVRTAASINRHWLEIAEYDVAAIKAIESRFA